MQPLKPIGRTAVRLLNCPNVPARLKRVTLPMLSLLGLLLTGCAAPLRVTDSSSVPPLIEEAKQPPKPSVCQPNCLSGWRKLLDSLTQAVQPEKPVSQLTIK